MNTSELARCIDTIVVVILENRSFDHVLGHLSHPSGGNRADVRGIANLDADDWKNPNLAGVGVAPFFMDDGPLLTDLPHDSPDVATQLAWSSVLRTFAMNGFVRAFENKTHSLMDRPPVMGLLTPAGIPTTGPLADAFTICDQWFACLPTSTAPNRLMSMCGYTTIGETNIALPDQDTVYDWLTHNGVRWRVYCAGLPFFALMEKVGPLLLGSHFRRLDRLAADLRDEPDGAFPQVIFVEPDYHDCPIHFAAPCDNHAPLPMRPGEAFLGSVFATLRASPRWAKTALFVTYDEHGGFFDHVAPAAVPYRSPAGDVAFDTTGPRVPAIVASPYARARDVRHELFDNTSILRLLADRFTPGRDYSGAVAARRGITSASELLVADADNGANPAVITSAVAPAMPPVTSSLSGAFAAAAQRLVQVHGSDLIALWPELKGVRLSSP